MGLKEIKGDWGEGDCAVPAERKVTLSIEKQGGQQQAWTTGAVKGNRRKKRKERKNKKDNKTHRKKRNKEKEKPKNGHKPVCLSIF